MDRMATKKSHSWWWNSHISPKNSKWFAENIEEMDRSFKEMLKLMEEEGDSFSKKAEMYFQRRPELISHVKDFYRMYRSLAEKYDNVTGELRKSMPSEIQSEGSGSESDNGSESKPPRSKPGSKAAGFDFFLGSGGSSDHSRKCSDGSSTSSDSDSGDDTKDLSADNTSKLHQKILQLENELFESNKQIDELEKKSSSGRCELLHDRVHENCSLRISELENTLSIADEKLQVAEPEILRLKQKLEEKNVSETAEVKLKEMISLLEAEVSQYKQEMEDLKVAMADATARFEADLLNRDQVIKKCEVNVDEILKAFPDIRTQVESEVTNIEIVVEEFRSEIKMISMEKSLLEIKLTEQDLMVRELESSFSQSRTSLEAKLISFKDEIKRHEDEASHYKQEIESLKMAMEVATAQFEADLFNRDRVIRKCKVEVDEILEALPNIRTPVESEVTNIETSVEELRSEIKMILAEKSLLEVQFTKQDLMVRELESKAASFIEQFLLAKSTLEIQVSHLSQSHNSLEAELISCKDEITLLEEEKTGLIMDNNKQIEELNRNLDAIKLTADMLASEKNELSDKMNTVLIDIKDRDEWIGVMTKRMHQLHLEHAKLIAEAEEARSASDGLRSQVNELEEIVEGQMVAISDAAELKREAIRQLCFSIEHYRDGYHQLRQAILRGHMRRSIAT